MSSNANIKSTRLVVGMEIHVELATETKMFTRAPNVAHPDHYDAPPNSLTDPVVLALPGALPVMNRAAIEMSMLVGLALNCTIAPFSKWDRKNYFYPDLPKGYQISQYDLPLCLDGEMRITGEDGHDKRIGIIRAHLEEDAGKLGHELPGGRHYEGSLVDYNRAGTPLLEIVTQPDLDSAEDAVIFCRELHSLCRFLGVTGGIMQRGHLRFEPNINVVITTEDGRTRDTPIVEIKNLNSFRAVKGAIEHEFTRQVEAWKTDGLEQGRGMKSTRGWDDDRQSTFIQREKEDAHDYRYFPDPDLVPVVVDDAWRDDAAAQLPELPRARRMRYTEQFNLAEVDARTLSDDRGLCELYEACIDSYQQLVGSAIADAHAGAEAAKLLLNVGGRLVNERDVEIDELGITPTQVAQIIVLRDDNAIGSSAADTLFERLCDSDADAADEADTAGLLQVSDASQLDAWIDAVVADNQQAADDFAAGKDVALGRLTGAVMKLSNGSADAKAVQQRLRERLRA